MAMPYRIVFAQFWRDLRAQRLRTGLTLLGLGWGTFCVAVLLSFGEGLERKQMESSAAMGDRLILIWGSRTSLSFQGLPQGRYIQLEDGDADVIERRVEDVDAISPEYNTDAAMRGPAGTASFGVSGVRPEFGAMRKIIPEPGGRFLDSGDQAERRRVAVIGYQVHQDLFGGKPAVGQTVEISGVPFLVIGTMAKKQQDSNYNGPDDRKVFIPSTAAQASLGQRYPDNLVVEVRPGAKSKPAMDEIRRALAPVHHFDPGDTDALMDWDVGQMIAMLQTVFIAFKVFLSLAGALTLAVAGIGVANIMNMVIEDRTSQIGISMALGARRRWILSQVLLETLLVTAIGGSLGILFAAGVVYLSRFFPIQDVMGSPSLSGQTAALTAGLLGAIGIVAGMGPARRAALMRPAEALRS